MITLDKVTKRYDNGQVAVRELSLEVPEGDICILVGPSGCGKTTTMRMVNRLIEPTAGRILLDGEDVTDVDPVGLRRRMGYVIQQVGLFPHHTVADNVATVPLLLGWDKARVGDRTDELLELVGLPPADYRDRYPHQLSGGQRQRVGVARALAADPPVLLMDEPFGAIDPISRDRLQREFLRLQETVRKTIVFVTHDIDEAVTLGDRIAVMDVGGELARFGTPNEILSDPGSDFVADFVGADRGLKRLDVMTLERTDLEVPAVTLEVALPLAEARRRLDDAGWVHAPVVDDGRLVGVLRRSATEGDAAAGRTVGDAAVALDARVGEDHTLKDAFAALLLDDAGWVAVVDGDETLLGVLSAEHLHEVARHRAR
ncbi:betaine/proline/choline family ABC transporter ATP-binding protein [Iamia majanohamensis]|uniref:ABC-type quaternary amine transporter n=1 Tax=Iamia majanohamensis TaxID=467976 RepID=A0AAF0BRS0_9ACTN|nr:betaine/proline/choline family ABC transporter ATP-binding protein [Iamia majanohamensis]WCO67191.1 betaine/proline/choline family ABC transporter ATP-binding protein [Iamia majanohamensis]